MVSHQQIGKISQTVAIDSNYYMKIQINIYTKITFTSDYARDHFGQNSVMLWSQYDNHVL